MAKTELQRACAAATEPNQKTVAVSLGKPSAVAGRENRKKSEIVLPGFGKLVEQKKSPSGQP
jgi:hypothetical protein